MDATEIGVVAIWTLLVVTSVVLIFKALAKNAGIAFEPLGTRFAISSFAFIPSLVSLVVTLLSLLHAADGGSHGGFTWPLLFFGNLLAAPVALGAAYLRRIRRKMRWCTPWR
jgi:hypothetical protein